MRMSTVSLKRRATLIFAIILTLIILIPVTVWAQATWHKAQLIANNPGNNSAEPHMAVSGNNVVVVWSQYDGNIYWLYSNYSTDGGATWHSAQLIENNTGVDAIHPEVAISGFNVVAVWEQSDGNNYRIYRNYSTDGGATWHTAQFIDNAGWDGDRARVTISGLNAVAVWTQSHGITEERICSNYSTNGGADWQGTQLIDNAGHAGWLPALSMSGLKVVAIWNQDFVDDQKICRNYSIDGGATWQGPQLIENTGGNSNIGPNVAMSGLNVAAVWSHYDVSQSRVYANYSIDGGMTWHIARSIDNAIFGGIAPDIAISGPHMVAIWNQRDGSNTRVCSNYSLDRGATWHSARLIDNAGHDVDYCDVAISGLRVVAVWGQKDSSGDGIYSGCSTDGGASWDTPQLLKELRQHTGGWSNYHPQVAISGLSVVAVWNQSDKNRVVRIYSNYGSFPEPPPVPGVSVFGLLPLVLLFFGAMVWLLWRKAAGWGKTS
jgi:Neuraminidase (sialidase)